MTTTDDEAPLFAGLKVIDCASYIAGPAAATIMADYGAEVIKIEPLGAGDAWRNQYKRPGLPETDLNYPWLMDSRNKLGLALDLKAPAGRAILDRLLSQADVFITNTPLPARGRLGIRYEDLAAKHPRLIYASLTAYGEVGEEAAKTGFDATAYWARSGLMDEVKADRDAAPARSVAGMGDHPTASALYGGIVTALYRREKTGRGGEVRAALMGSGMWANAYLIQARICGAPHPPRPPREESISALQNMYRTEDSRWFMLAVANDRQWPALTRALDAPQLTDDPRFADAAARRANAVELMHIFDEIFAERPIAEWRTRMDEAGLTFGIVGTTEEIAADPQALDAGFLRPLADTGLVTIDSPFTLTESPKVPVRLAPGHGEHSEQVLRAAGYSEAEIAAFRAEGVIETS